jgi:uncharacterized protein
VTRREREKRLQEIYDAIPKVKCKGMCFDACGPIPLHHDSIERQRMTKRDRRTKELPTDSGVPMALAGKMCPHLTHNGSCRIYSDRPAICRLWGVTESLPCHHGCQPERVVSDEEAYLIHREIEVLSGRNPPSEEEIKMQVRELRDRGYFEALRPHHPMEKDYKSNTVKVWER